MSFFLLEGPNGGGKTTVLNKLADMGVDTFESPGNGTELSKVLRPWCRGTAAPDIDPKVQFLLFSAARVDEYARRVKNATHPVVAGRWWTSTFVYQNLYQGLPLSMLEATLDPEEKIDGVFLLTAAPEVLIERVRKEREANPAHGKCSWTADYEKTLASLYRIYMEDLPLYLTGRGIPVSIMFTEYQSADGVSADIYERIMQ
jgi:thymidylate kinase